MLSKRYILIRTIILFTMALRSFMLKNIICKRCNVLNWGVLLNVSTESRNELGLGEEAEKPRLTNEKYESKKVEIPTLTNTSTFYKLAEYRHVYPEFLPDPNIPRRHYIREKLERADMMARRKQIEIPEFYVGSIMSVTSSDPYSPGKSNRFVGVCILREEHGMRSYFILRNVIDSQGIEIRYDMYNPCIQKIQVLRLEKRLDHHLVYLRDALPEYSTFPFDMEAEARPEGGFVPINTLKVKLKPKPWYARWERFNLKGIDLDSVTLKEKMIKQAEKYGEKAEYWNKYDLMKDYRQVTLEDDQALIWKEVHEHHLEIQDVRRRERRKQLLEKKKTV